MSKKHRHNPHWKKECILYPRNEGKTEAARLQAEGYVTDPRCPVPFEYKEKRWDHRGRLKHIKTIDGLLMVFNKIPHECKGSLIKCCNIHRCETCHIRHLDTSEGHTKQGVYYQQALFLQPSLGTQVKDLTVVREKEAEREKVTILPESEDDLLETYLSKLTPTQQLRIVERLLAKKNA